MEEPDSKVGAPGTGNSWDDKELPSCSTWPDAQTEAAAAFTPGVQCFWGICLLVLFVGVCLVWPGIPTAFLAMLTALGFFGVLDRTPSTTVSSQTSKHLLCESASAAAQTEADTNEADVQPVPEPEVRKRKYGPIKPRVEGDDLGVPNSNPGDDFMGNHLSANHYKAELLSSTRSDATATANRTERPRGKHNDNSSKLLRKNFSKNCTQERTTLSGNDLGDLLDLSQTSQEKLSLSDKSTSDTDFEYCPDDKPCLSATTKRIIEQRKKSPSKGTNLAPKPKISPRNPSKLRGSLSETVTLKSRRKEMPVFAKVWRVSEPEIKLAPFEINNDDVSQINSKDVSPVSKAKPNESTRQPDGIVGNTAKETGSVAAADVEIVILDKSSADNPCSGNKQDKAATYSVVDVQTAAGDDMVSKDMLNETTSCVGKNMNDTTTTTRTETPEVGGAVDRNVNCHDCQDGAADCQAPDFLSEPITAWLGDMQISATCGDHIEVQKTANPKRHTITPATASAISSTGHGNKDTHLDEGSQQTGKTVHCLPLLANKRIEAIKAETSEVQTQTVLFADILRLNIRHHLQAETRRFYKRRSRLKLKYSREMGKLKRELGGKNQILTSLQLKIPALDDEIRQLRAERNDLHYDLGEEQNKSRTLMCRLSDVYEKLMVISSTQQQQQQQLQQQQQF